MFHLLNVSDMSYYDLMDSFNSPPVISWENPNQQDSSPASIYDVQPYSWDGKSRPNIDDYTSPWIEKASQTMYKYTASAKRKSINAEITYAKNQLQNALAKYQADFDFWSEQDERNYTSQSAQKQRYEEAGFNLGYLYNQVDSGNSAVGYSNPDVSYEPNENIGDNLGGVKVVADIVGTIVGVASSLLSAGVKVAELPAKLAQMKSNTELNKASLEWTNLLRSVDSDGNKVGTITKSLAFELQNIGVQQASTTLKCSQQQLSQLTEFTSKCAAIYELQGTDPRKEASTALQDMIKNIDLSWLGESQGIGRFILQMLGYTAVLNL